MNYWSEFGWMIIPMNIVEISFTCIMCFTAHILDKRRKK